MPQIPHSQFTHINMPDFDGFLAYMQDNPLLANSVQNLELTGFIRSHWKDPARNSEMTDWSTMELDVYDEFDFEWDWDTKELKDMPSSCRWTKLPRTFIHSLIATPRLFPRLETLALNSMFLEYNSEDVRWLEGAPELPLESLILREVGTTANNDHAFLQFLNMFDPLHITIDTLPAPDTDIPYSSADLQELAATLGPKRTTSLEIGGNPDAVFTLELVRAIPALSNNLTKLELHIREAYDVGALSNLLKKVGRKLKELTVDLRPVCYVSKPEVHMDRTSPSPKHLFLF